MLLNVFVGKVRYFFPARAVVPTAALIVMLVGLFVMVGWTIQSQLMISILPSFPAMVFNTALGFFLCAVSLLFTQINKSSYSLFPAVFASLIGLSTLIMYIFKVDLGIDELVFEDFIKSNSDYPGRMSISTALCFVLTSFCLVFPPLFKRFFLTSVFAETLCTFNILISFAALMDHLGLINAGYSWFLWESMAIHTSLSFIILNGAILVKTWAARDRNVSPFYMTFPSVFLVSAFVFDAYTPLGVAAGIAYIPFVLCAFWRPNLIAPFIFALIASVFIVCEFYASFHVDVPMLKVLINRIGVIVGIWIIAVLIYIVKLRERAVLYSAESLNAILNNTVDGIISIDAQGSIETFNKACEKIFGYSAHEVIGQNVKILMPEPYHGEHDGYLKNYHGTGVKKIIGIDREVQGKRKSGEVFPIDLSVSEVSVHGRKLYSGIVRDITERKKFEKELESRAEILEASLNEIYVFDAKSWKFIQVNRGARENLGYSMQELSEMTPLDIKPDYTAKGFEKIVAPLMKGKEQNIVFETIHKRKNGALYNVEIHLQLAQYQSKKVFVAIILDITERKKAENEIMRSNEELERFAYIASHDLQEPLRMVNSFTELLRQDYGEKMDDQAKEYMHFITDASGRMQLLVADLLEYSRVGIEDSGFLEFSASKQVRHAIDNLKEAIEETQAQITVDEMPDVYANPVRFSRLIQNLIGNAIKYRSPDRVPEIHVGVEEQSKVWKFSVHDNGIGIREEYLEQIFVIFKRLHNKSEYSGTGIGLAVCEKIVESFGGQLWVVSKFGEGSVFYFTLPKYEKTGEIL